MAVKGTITKNYEFESNQIAVTNGNSLQFTIDKLDDVIDVLLALQAEVDS